MMTEWISIKDRLPPLKENGGPSDLVLVYCPEVGVRVGYQHRGRLRVECTYCEGTYTHWLPLPKPPGKDD